VQRRVALVMREEVEEDPNEESRLPHLTFANGQAIAETRNGQAQRVVAGAGGGGAHRAVANNFSGATTRRAGAQILLATRGRGAGGHGAPDIARSTPASSSRSFI
jgi:hypothetical protein